MLFVQAIANGVAVPGFSASIGYFDTYRREKVPANLVQASSASAPLLQSMPDSFKFRACLTLQVLVSVVEIWGN